jgi:hypothetical protein
MGICILPRIHRKNVTSWSFSMRISDFFFSDNDLNQSILASGCLGATLSCSQSIQDIAMKRNASQYTRDYNAQSLWKTGSRTELRVVTLLVYVLHVKQTP